MSHMLFVSYSHRDESYKDYVVSHFGVAEKQGLLKTWDDRRIKGGGDWRREIEAALAQAKVAILLVSRHSLTSDFILNEEVSTMLRRRDQEGLLIYPIVIRACDWEAVNWLKELNLRPTDGKPLARFSLDRRDEVMAGISKEIRGFLDSGVETTRTISEELNPSPVDDEIDRLAEQTETLSDELGTTKDALNGMFEILAEHKDVPVEQLETKLKEITERHAELTKMWQSLPKSNDDPEITSKREQATQALEDGDYDQAAELLKEARSIIRQARQEHQEALDRSLLGEAAILNQQGQLERTRLNYRKAAEHFAEAASLVQAHDSEIRLGYLMECASVLHDQGRDFGDNSALIEAIDIYQANLDDRLREREPLQWAMTQMNLGVAFWLLGMREGGTERLEQAVDAYHEALEGRIREHAPLQWAKIQMNLGNALRGLGSRESSTERLEQAVNAYQNALKERTRESAPLQWANTQIYLALALSNLGERESGTEKLEQAVDIYREALEEFTREREPLQWAKIQNNLGFALSNLGSRESGTKKLRQAVEAYREALKERTRERVPLNWAMTQMRLGNAIRVLGSRESGTEKLEQAVDIYREALEEFTHERVPLYWAMTQNNLGTALRVLGERESGTEKLEQAVDIYREALKERAREHVPLDWATTQMDFGLAYKAIAEKTKDEAILVQGIEAIKTALTVFEDGQMAYNIEKAKRNLAGAEAFLAHLRGEGSSK